MTGLMVFFMPVLVVVILLEHNMFNKFIIFILKILYRNQPDFVMFMNDDSDYGLRKDTY